jgi:hypothetical protein
MKEMQDAPQILIETKKTEQAHFCLGFRAFSMFDKRRYASSVLSAILGGGMSSRLFMEVRERRGLCYYISSGRELYADVGNFVTQAGVTNKIEKVKFDLPDVAHTFKKGHRLMIQIQSSWFPLADRNPQKFVNIYEADIADFQKATIRIHHDAANSSNILLPVVK